MCNSLQRECVDPVSVNQDNTRGILEIFIEYVSLFPIRVCILPKFSVILFANSCVFLCKRKTFT